MKYLSINKFIKVYNMLEFKYDKILVSPVLLLTSKSKEDKGGGYWGEWYVDHLENLNENKVASWFNDRLCMVEINENMEIQDKIYSKENFAKLVKK